jgi:hypothetical protein
LTPPNGLSDRGDEVIDRQVADLEPGGGTALAAELVKA